jgi:hypothetical protein
MFYRAVVLGLRRWAAGERPPQKSARLKTCPPLLLQSYEKIPARQCLPAGIVSKICCRAYLRRFDEGLLEALNGIFIGNTEDSLV